MSLEILGKEEIFNSKMKRREGGLEEMKPFKALCAPGLPNAWQFHERIFI